jgi:hypothetical protein
MPDESAPISGLPEIGTSGLKSETSGFSPEQNRAASALDDTSFIIREKRRLESKSPVSP